MVMLGSICVGMVVVGTVVVEMEIVGKETVVFGAVFLSVSHCGEKEET